MYRIYGKPTCVWCYRARQLLEDRDLPYQYYEIGKDITREDFINAYPDQKTVPMIFYSGKLLGGYQQLKEYLNTSE